MTESLGSRTARSSADGRHYRMYIDGAFVEARDAATMGVEDPSTGVVFATCARAGVADVELAITAARRAFDDGPWQRATGVQRANLLRAVAAGLRERADEIAHLESLQQGHLLAESVDDVSGAAKELEYFAGLACDRQGQPLRIEGDLSSAVTREPAGVVAAIVPWNYPLAIAVTKLAPALAAGNAVILKPASLTPLTALVLAEVCDAAGVPPGVVQVVTGPGSEVGGALAASPRVDMVTLTGSVEVGREVGRLAAGSVKRSVLELGGKSANVVFADCGFEAAIQGQMLAMFTNAGQVCTAGTRLIVERRLHDEFVAALAERARGLVVGPALDPATEMGPLVSAQQLATVERYVAKGLEEGATLACGGRRIARPGHFHEPTIFTGVTPDMAIAREEIFGPVLVVLPFDDEDEAVALANDTDYGLSAGIWTGNLSRALRVSSRLQAGAVWVNTWFASLNSAAGGGRKQSGVGVEGGVPGLEEYTVVKHIAMNMSDEPCGYYPAKAGGRGSA
jgi:acyl-CoA reductase-like NAD-dependent aldehyde dehydrogenase